MNNKQKSKTVFQFFFYRIRKTVLNPEPSLDEYWTQKHSLETNYTPNNLIKKKKYQLVASSLRKEEEKVKTFSSKLIENFY